MAIENYYGLATSIVNMCIARLSLVHPPLAEDALLRSSGDKADDVAALGVISVVDCTSASVKLLCRSADEPSQQRPLRLATASLPIRMACAANVAGRHPLGAGTAQVEPADHIAGSGSS